MKPPRPVVSVSKDATVMDGVRAMATYRVGAVVILEGEQLLGVFSERDVVTRVALERRAPEKTSITEVMTTKVVTVREKAERSIVLRLMSEHHIRHLPV